MTKSYDKTDSLRNLFYRENTFVRLSQEEPTIPVLSKSCPLESVFSISKDTFVRLSHKTDSNGQLPEALVNIAVIYITIIIWSRYSIDPLKNMVITIKSSFFSPVTAV